MNTPSPSLPELQRAVRQCLVQGDEDAAAAQVLADGIAPAERLAIYRNTFVSALTRALRLSYPAVERLVGTEFFEGAARIFIESEPPRCACLDDYGAGFADFLAGFAPAGSLAYLPGVARLEWAVGRALHAPDAERLGAARPAASLVHADHPVDAIWRAVLERDDAALTGIDPASGPVRLLVHRAADGGIEVHRLSGGTSQGDSR